MGFMKGSNAYPRFEELATKIDDAIARRPDCVVTVGGLQSNHTRCARGR